MFCPKWRNILTVFLPDDSDRRTQVSDRGQPIFGARLKGRRHKMFHIFHVLQSDIAFEVISPFLCTLNAVFSEESFSTSMASLSLYLTSGQYSVFSACWILIGSFKHDRTEKSCTASTSRCPIQSLKKVSQEGGTCSAWFFRPVMLGPLTVYRDNFLCISNYYTFYLWKNEWVSRQTCCYCTLCLHQCCSCPIQSRSLFHILGLPVTSSFFKIQN